MVASKSVFYSQGKSNIIAMEISRMFPGKNTKSKRCSIFHCHVSSRVQLSTEVFVLVAWFKWRVWRVMLSGMHSSSNPFDKRPHPFSHFKNSGSTTFFLYKKKGQLIWTLGIVEGDFWLSTIVWVKSEIAWSVMAEALRLNGEKGVGTPKDSLGWRDPKNRVVCSSTRPLFRLKYQKKGFQVKLVECHW